MNTKKTLVASAIAMVLSSSLAYAAEEAKESKAEEIEVIEVYGMRSSLRSAIDRKKQAGTATDSIVAEDISDFPDKNIGEALQRVTGVQLGREFGEGTAVSIRGVEPQLVNVEVNGVSAIGASDPFAGAGRSVDFASMSTDLVKALDVIKGSEARLTEGGIGGTIKIITRKPNDFEDNFLQVSAENQYNDLTENNNQKYNFTGVYKLNNDFGAMLNVTMSDKDSTYHALKNTEWVRQADYDGSLEKTFVDPDYASITDVGACPDSACQAQWYDFRARIPRNSVWSRDEDRISANGMLQFNVSQDLSTYVGFTHTSRKFDQVDSNLQLEVASEKNLQSDGFKVGNNHNVSQYITREATMVNRSIINDWELETNIIDAGFTLDKELWTLEGTFGFTTQTQTIDQIESRVNSNKVADVTVEFADNGAPIYDLGAYGGHRNNVPSQLFDPNDPSTYWFYTRVYNNDIDQENDQKMAKLDYTYRLDNDIFSTIRAGVRISSEYQDNNRDTRRITRVIGQKGWTAEDQTKLITDNSFNISNYFGDYDVGVPVTQGWLALKPLDFYNNFMSDIADTVTEAELAMGQAAFYEVEIDTKSLYLQADFDTELAGLPFWGNLGVRYVQSDVDTTGNAIVRVQVDNPDATPDPDGTIPNMIDPNHPEAFNDVTTLSHDYSEVLPSINMNFGLIEDELILYVGAAQVMAHPKAKDLNIAASCLLRLDTESANQGKSSACSAGNPKLEPYLANQFDIALNWYVNEDTMLAAAYFTKEMDAWTIDRLIQYDVDFFSDGNLYDVNQKINGSGAKTQGVEIQASTFFSMLPAPFNNMGVNANYTYMDSEDVGLFNKLTHEELEFPSQSKNSYNVSWFYETKSLSLKLAYNYRDSYLYRPSDRGGNPVYVDDAGFLDAKLVYRPQSGLLKNVKFHIDARNLLEEGNIYQNGPGRISEIRYSGREFSLGFTYKM